MLSKRISRYIKSLQLKKYRKQEQAFVVEGAKAVLELVQSDFQIEYLLGTSSFLEEMRKLSSFDELQFIEVDHKQLEELGTFKTNNAAMAVVKCPPNEPFKVDNGLILVLDDVRDPGNLGTIIRMADWYGIHKIICSSESADLYNPKVIAATMGSFTRVKLWYTNLSKVLQECALPVYGTLLSGKSIYEEDLLENALIVFGNESKGISAEVKPFITHPIHIPKRGGAESLNVAIASAIVLDNFFRN